MIQETIAGSFVGAGVECPLFRLEDGEQITLTGNIPDLVVGQTARLRGRWARLSTCMQGRTFHVLGRDGDE